MSAIDPICLQLPADYAERELAGATAVLRAELTTVTFHNHGRGLPGEVIMHRPDGGGRWGIARITKLQAAKMARDLIDYAMDGL